MSKAEFRFDCVSPQIDMDEFDHIMNKAKYITYENFIRNVSGVQLTEIAKNLGYYTGKKSNYGLRLQDDYAVSFMFSPGKKNWWIMRQSSIEYFFSKGDKQ